MEPAEIEKSVGDLEVAVDRLRSLYEQYFMGIEKLEPTVPRKDVDRRIHAMRKEQIRNTAVRFRFQMILQRYNVYQTHWQRICREIENGTYKRHMLRAERRFAAESGTGRGRRPALPDAGATPSQDIARQLAELDDDFAPSPAPGPKPVPSPVPSPVSPQKAPLWRKVEPSAPRQAPPAPAPAPPGRAPLPRPAPAAGPPQTKEDLPDARVRQIYAQYVEAKRRSNESTAAITYEAVAKSLRESSAKLREKTGKPVDFEVAMKDGKAILKPVIK